MAVKSRLPKKEFVSKTGVEVKDAKCRKCMRILPPEKFFTATDIFLDANGLMSVCKDCINDLYDRIYSNEHSIERAILKVCRIMNIKYDERAVEAAKKDVESRTALGKDTATEKVFGRYKNKLMMVQKTRITDRDTSEDFTFVEPEIEVKERIAASGFDDQEYFEEAWGKNVSFTADDYQYLEQEFSKWKKTTKCDTQGEEILVREMCYKQNDIRKARNEGKDVTSLVKSLIDIQKASNLTPALQNAASAGKSQEAFGNWIRDIETKTPAEWWQDQEKYKDSDGLGKDISDIKRSIGNFITGSRDFNTTDLEEMSDPEDDSILPD